MTNTLIRGYTNFGFEAWTVPCLYIAGKYLRIFAIKADEQFESNANFTVGFRDDFNPESAKNEKLEEAARVLNRIFTLCHSDRYILQDAAL
jgi:COP9 signalosome complex subunit 12